MAFLSNIALFVFVLNFASLFSHKAPLYSAKDNNVIADDYILVLNDIFSSASSTQDKDKWVEDTRKKLKDRYGCFVEKEYRLHNFNAFRVKMDKAKVSKLLTMKEIQFVEQNRKVYASPYEYIGETEPSNDTSVKVCYSQNTGRNMWGLSRISRRNAVPSYGNAYYDYGPLDDGHDIDAYVIDTGIYIEHEQFDGRAVWGFSASSLAETEDNTDLNGHGTHVAGIIGGRTYGVAKAANLIAVKVLDYTGVGTMFDVIEGIEYAYNDFKNKVSRGLNPKGVCNLSLGAKGQQPSLETAIERATSGGLTFVVAAGNEYDDACLYTPAKVSNVITVGSININDKLSEFSNYGTCVDILAPGESILSSYSGSTTAVALLSGTSMAAPHVAGVAARYLSTVPFTPTSSEVQRAVIGAATVGVIDLGESSVAKQETPNKVAYFTCAGDLMSDSGSNLLSSKLSVIISVIIIMFVKL